MPTAAYGRYSSDEQRPTSIDDQLRRCRELAEREGLTISPRLEFCDSAVSGLLKGRAKRLAFRRLVDAIEARECDVVVADEASRLARELDEGALLMRFVDEMGVRFITADGIDTSREGWRTLWTFKLMQARLEVESTGSRTTRGMVGQLERGYQIAQTPYGYRPVHDIAESGRVRGTRWTVHEPEAAVVRQMYQWRHGGLSAAGIAARLQQANVLPPGASRKGGKPYWRAASVYRVLANTVYRGAFVWNGSSFVKARAAKRRKTVHEQVYQRPELRLVSDEVWYACNPPAQPGAPRRDCAPRGGGKHLFAGLVRCSECGASLAVGGGKSLSLSCPQCESAVRVGAKSNWLGYSSVAAARAALDWVLLQVFTGPVLDEFRRRLEARLREGPAQEEREAKARLVDLEAVIQRLKMLMANPKLDPAVFEQDMEVATSERRVLQARLEKLRQNQRRLTPEVLAIQQAVDPLALLRQLLTGDGEVYQVRATLRRLLHCFVFIARPRRGESVFRIGLQPGVYVAEVSDTAVIDQGVVEFEVTASTTGRRPVQWILSGHRVAATEE